jgi:uncharacterized repeat protein (TIGR02543 family)
MAVDAGQYHSVALKSDGSLIAWGVDSGLISDSDYRQVTDTPAGSNFIAVAAGRYHSLAIAAESGANAGSITAWGRDADGQATPPSGNDFVAVAGGAKHSLALRSDGTLAAWGIVYDSPYTSVREFYGDFGQVTDMPSGNGFIAIAAGDSHNVALKSDGSIVTWGDDSRELDNIPLKPPEGDFNGGLAIAAGGYHSLAIESNTPIAAYTLSVYSEGMTSVPIDSSTGHGGTTDYFKTVDEGLSVILTAPATFGGATFVEWTGAVTSSSQEITLTMDAGKSVTARYQYILSVSSVGASDVPITSATHHDGTTDYTRTLVADTLVYLTAPDLADGRTFIGWTGAETSSNQTINFTMTGNKSVTANYETPIPQYLLTVSSSGASGVSISSTTGHGGTTTYTKTLDEGTSVTLTAPALAGKTFVGWSGGVTSSSQEITLTMDASKSVTANYITEYTLSVSSSGASSVSITSATGHGGTTDYTKTVIDGTTVTLTAPVLSGKTFTGWTGSVNQSTPTISFSMTADKTVTANYAVTTYSLSVNSSGAAGVLITSTTAHGGVTNYTKTVADGAAVNLTAPEYVGSGASRKAFVNWFGAVSSTSRTINLTMTSAKTLTANYVDDPVTYTLSVSSSGASSVSITSATGHGGTTDYTKTVIDGTTVTLTAPVLSGKTFTGWTGSVTSSSSTISFSMTSAKSVTANYAVTTYSLSVSSSGASGVSITSTTGQGGVTNYTKTITSGTSVNLQAPQYVGSGASRKAFSSWSGSVSSTSLSINLTMTAGKYTVGLLVWRDGCGD